MPYSLRPFASIGLDDAALRRLLEERRTRSAPRLRRLWSYYRNPVTLSVGGRARCAQEAGLPPRLGGERGALRAGGALRDDRWTQREVVIENDIAWRVHAMVDFMFGRPVVIASNARSPRRRREIERLLDAAIEASGGVGLLQDMALLGSVYGHADLLVRADALFAQRARGGDADIDRALALAGLARVEVVEPTRGAPVIRASDHRAIDAYVIEVEPRRAASPEPSRWWRAASAARGRGAAEEAAGPGVVEVLSADAAQVYEGERLTEERENPLGALPVVHVQNLRQPFVYEGLSDVEPLIPLQDELNTRLSDRANRVTLQSFRMYLAKGVDGFAETAVGPGQVWSTDNLGASVEAFGGDASSPSEDAHIAELREAMDKASGVTPIVAGVLTKIGNLSSENALRVTLQGLLLKTARKRVTYGRGLRELCALLLEAFDRAGVYRTDPEDRAVRVEWHDPLAPSEADRLQAALLKQRLGVPAERLLSELGYAPADAGIE